MSLKYHYLKKLSGRNYHPDAVKNILISLGFEIIKDGIDEIRVAVPFHKTDISLPADIVEEVLRIDGLDNVEIPETILITPAVEETYTTEAYKEKIAGYLVGLGFHEMITNSITNGAFFSEKEQDTPIKMLNNLSAELNVLRPSMLETGLEALAYNLNRKNNSLRFFEFGKTYQTPGTGKYIEQEQLCLYVTGQVAEKGWRNNEIKADFFYLKGVAASLLQILDNVSFETEITGDDRINPGMKFNINGKMLIHLGTVSNKILNRFDIKQTVLFAELNWDLLVKKAGENKPVFREISKFPAVYRDLAIVVDKQLAFAEVEKSVHKIRLDKLQEVKLFDIFESEKLGMDKKSMAISFLFSDEEKTLTDNEIDGWMNKIMTTLEKDLKAQIRK